MAATTTAFEKRAYWRARFSRKLARLLPEHDISQAALARHIGAGDRLVQRWCDPEARDVPGVPDICLMPSPLAVDVLRWLAEEHRQQVHPEPGVDDAASWPERLYRVQKESAGVVTAITRAMASDGGVIGDRELDEIEREGIEQLEQAMQLVNHCKTERRRRQAAHDNVTAIAAGR